MSFFIWTDGFFQATVNRQSDAADIRFCAVTDNGEIDATIVLTT
jgi:hypothetical protein